MAPTSRGLSVISCLVAPSTLRFFPPSFVSLFTSFDANLRPSSVRIGVHLPRRETLSAGQRMQGWLCTEREASHVEGLSLWWSTQCAGTRPATGIRIELSTKAVLPPRGSVIHARLLSAHLLPALSLLHLLRGRMEREENGANRPWGS